MENEAVSRRRFCRVMVVAPFISLSNFFGIVGCATTRVIRGNLRRGRVALKREDFESEGNESRTFVVKIPELESPIIVVRAGLDKYRAFSVRCTHQGCHVRPRGETLTCPCHGSTFDFAGRVIRGPAKAPLQQFDVEITARGIEIVVERLEK